MRKENNLVFFVFMGILLAFLILQSLQSPPSPSYKVFPLLYQGKLNLFFSSQMKDPGEGSFLYTPYDAKEKKWVKNKTSYPGALKGVGQDGKYLYLFFDHHYGFYLLEKGEFQQQDILVDYPEGFYPLTVTSQKGRVLLWGREEDQVYPLAIREKTFKKLPVKIPWQKGWKNFSSMALGERVYLFYSSSEGVFYFAVEKGKVSSPYSTTLKDSDYGLAFGEDQFFLIGDGKEREKGKVRLRFLSGKIDRKKAEEEKGNFRIPFIPQADLVEDMEGLPKAIELASFEGKIFLFLAQKGRVEYLLWEKGKWGNRELLFPRVSFQIPPFIQVGLLTLFILFLIALFSNTLQRRKDRLLRERGEDTGADVSGSLNGRDPFFRPPAPLWKRAFAYGMDIIPLGMIAVLSQGLPKDRHEIPVEMIVGYYVFYYLISIPYFSLCEYFWGKTFGKYMMKLKVVGKQGKLSLAQAIVRNGMRLVDDYFSAMVGLVAIILTPRAQRVGDLIADTMVVEEEESDIYYLDTGEEREPEDYRVKDDDDDRKKK